MSKSNVTGWKNGQEPSITTAVNLANYLGVDVSELIGNKNGEIDIILQAINSGTTEDEVCKELERSRPAVPDRTLPKNAILATGMIPIYATIPAGSPALMNEEILGYAPAVVHNPQECFFVVVRGDSMINAGIQSGDMVLVRDQEEYAEIPTKYRMPSTHRVPIHKKQPK